MKTRALLIPVVALVVVVFGLAGCGDDKKTADTSAADTTTADTAAPDTVADATTTVAAADPVAERVAAAQEVEGTYAGEWHNTTFNSTGAIDSTVTVDAATAIVTVTMDLGGNVFGASDPDPLVAEFDLNNEGPFAGTNELFGDFTIEYTDGHLTFTAPSVPGVGNREMTVEGNFSAGTFSGTYIIVDLAEGTFEATRA